jgi:hypothetical protein
MRERERERKKIQREIEREREEVTLRAGGIDDDRKREKSNKFFKITI